MPWIAIHASASLGACVKEALWMKRIELESVRTLWSDGGHNAFTSMVSWRGRYWIAFRSADSHRSLDGRILVISSPDLRTWDPPITVIDTPHDDRDPTLYVWQDTLFVASASFRREWLDPSNPWGGLKEDLGPVTYITRSTDGIHFDPPKEAYEPDHFLWWAIPAGDRLYGSARLRRIRVEGGIEEKEYASKLVTSTDGLNWETISVISAERLGSETALVLLEDKSLLAFVRHDAKGVASRPEFKVADPPYTKWRTVYDFEFQTNGPSLAVVDGMVIASGRGFFEDPNTPLVTEAVRDRKRGLLVMTFDVSIRTMTPQVMISHEPPTGVDRAHGGPDIAYAGTVDLGNGRFAMSYYDGFKNGPCDIKLATFRFVS